MLKCATSLWSADLANLATDMKRVERYSERFHIDVVDGHYAQNLLFFPDMVKSLRPYTTRPFEVHLMVTEPGVWAEPFIDSGADIIICALDSMDDPAEIIRKVKSRGKKMGIALSLDETVDELESYWDHLDVVTICGTQIGIKGAMMDDVVPEKIRRAREVIRKRGLTTEIEADGGIRRTTVPLIQEAGADYIVPGSLMFGESAEEMRQWLATL
ncbi:MAG: ribulose-phosphate 3-epimerase [Chloroflexota bacterium]